MTVTLQELLARPDRAHLEVRAVHGIVWHDPSPESPLLLHGHEWRYKQECPCCGPLNPATGQAVERDTPPTTWEIINALAVGDRVEEWVPGDGWSADSSAVEFWEELIATYGDQAQPGYRIVRGES